MMNTATIMPAPPSLKVTLTSLGFLLICLAIVVLLAKSLSPAVEGMVASIGAPASLVGVIIAAVVLLPEGLAAVRAASRNHLQTSLNLSLGSALGLHRLAKRAHLVAVCPDFTTSIWCWGWTSNRWCCWGFPCFIVMLSLSQGAHQYSLRRWCCW